jgi:hypothetical protein
MINIIEQITHNFVTINVIVQISFILYEKYSNESKLKVMKLDKVFEKLNKKTKKYCCFEKKSLKET